MLINTNYLSLPNDLFGPVARAARALLGIDQKRLAEMSGVSLPTIQPMEASDGDVRGVIGSLTKVFEALQREGIELISEHIRSAGGGRGVRLRQAGSLSGRAN